MCTTCIDGHILSLDQTRCEKEYLPTKLLSSITQAIIFVGVGVGLTSSTLLSSTSSMGFWALVNQYQLFLLLPFLKIYMPADLEYYLTEFELFSFDFNFLSGYDIPFLTGLIKDLDYYQEDIIFRNNGFSSGSFAVNYNNMVTAFLITFG